jgi:two-component system response regulator HydG
MQPRLLIVDDDIDMREALATLFSGEGHACEVAADATSALTLVDRLPFDAVVCDVGLSGMTGLELLDRVQRSRPTLPFVVITGSGDLRQAVDAVKRGAFEYLLKPFSPTVLQKVVADAVEARRLAAERASLRPLAAAELEMVGGGPAMRALQANIDSVARSRAPVLITGETGVGKELVARAIHARSSRRLRPFVAINTSAVSPELLESELFGHVRGAFTGAIHQRRGLLTEADGGTLLLDEIGDMPVALQAKLLRVLQFGDVRPVGGDHDHHVDVRILASTHRNLPALAEVERFRSDLYFRLNVLSVHVPPLRDRPEDIPELARHFLGQARDRAPSSLVQGIGEDWLRGLVARPWPGNIRELASVVERAVVLGVESVEATLGDRQVAACGGVSTAGWPFPLDAPWTLHRLTREYAGWALAQAGGSKSRAAETMGIDMSTLYRWLRAPPG